MSYFDWQTLSKPFTFQPVLPADDSCIKQDNVFEPIDYVKTGIVLLRIPAINLIPIWVLPGGFPPPPFPKNAPLIIGQYNYSVGTAITIINPLDVTLDPAGVDLNVAVAIRYRIGTTVFRYLLAKTVPNLYPVVTRDLFPFPSYTNQLIKGNFVIEFWQLGPMLITTPVGIFKDIFLKTGRIYFPSDYEDTGNVIQPTSTCLLNQLTTALPETLPTNQDPAGPWISN